MELPVEKTQKLDEGAHTGKIVDVEYRTTKQNYKYTDIVIEVVEGLQIKAGYPTKVMEGSALGQLLVRFGVVLAEGMSVDPDVLKGRECSFLVKHEGDYARVCNDTLKPAVAGPVSQDPAPSGVEQEKVV